MSIHLQIQYPTTLIDRYFLSTLVIATPTALWQPLDTPRRLLTECRRRQINGDKIERRLRLELRVTFSMVVTDEAWMWKVFVWLYPVL